MRKTVKIIVIWGGRNWGNQSSKIIFLSKRSFIRSLFLITEKNLFLSFKNQEILQLNLKQIFFFRIWWPHYGDPPGYSFSWNFSPKDILCEKTSAIRNCKHCNHNFKFMTQGGCRHLTGVLQPMNVYSLQFEELTNYSVLLRCTWWDWNC